MREVQWTLENGTDLLISVVASYPALCPLQEPPMAYYPLQGAVLKSIKNALYALCTRTKDNVWTRYIEFVSVI